MRNKDNNLMIFGLHHAQITIPTGTEEDARRFYCGVLGLLETPKPASLAGRVRSGGGAFMPSATSWKKCPQWRH